MLRFPYTLELIAGFKVGRRGLAFLTSTSGVLNAKETFGKLAADRKREVSARFDHWLDGGIFPKYHHGWNGDEYRNCYVFKWREKGTNHRLYGFLCHPRPKSDPRFQLCVLASHAVKPGWETDPAELNGANELRASAEVIEAIARIFPEYRRKHE